MKLNLNGNTKNILRIEERQSCPKGCDDGLSNVIKNIMVFTEDGMIYGFDSTEELSKNTTGSDSDIQREIDTKIFHRLDALVKSEFLASKVNYFLRAMEREDHVLVCVISDGYDDMFFTIRGLMEIDIQSNGQIPELSDEQEKVCIKPLL